MEYDYIKFEEYLIKILEKSQWDGTLDIGEELSPISEIKVAFDGYGDLEIEDANGEYEYVEHGNTNMESYAIYIHKDSAKRGFVFPEHDTHSFTFGNLVQHRPDEEVCLFAWHEFVEEEDAWRWHIIPLEDRLAEDNSLTAEQVMEILEVVVNRYFSE
jgi:hypothetical protein